VSFTASQAAIRRFGQLVSDLTDDADLAVNYTREHLSIGYSEGRMFFTVVEKADEVRDALVANYQHLARLADGSSREVTKTADYYRDTDTAAAARTDATYNPDGGTR
jgi:hypothetical protein